MTAALKNATASASAPAVAVAATATAVDRFIVVQTGRHALFGEFSVERTGSAFDTAYLDAVEAAACSADAPWNDAKPARLDRTVCLSQLNDALCLFRLPSDFPAYAADAIDARSVESGDIFADFRRFDFVGSLVEDEPEEEKRHDELKHEAEIEACAEDQMIVLGHKVDIGSMERMDSSEFGDEEKSDLLHGTITVTTPEGAVHELHFEEWVNADGDGNETFEEVGTRWEYGIRSQWTDVIDYEVADDIYYAVIEDLTENVLS